MYLSVPLEGDGSVRSDEALALDQSSRQSLQALSQDQAVRLYPVAQFEHRAFMRRRVVWDRLEWERLQAFQEDRGVIRLLRLRWYRGFLFWLAGRFLRGLHCPEGGRNHQAQWEERTEISRNSPYHARLVSLRWSDRMEGRRPSHST